MNRSAAVVRFPKLNRHRLQLFFSRTTACERPSNSTKYCDEKFTFLKRAEKSVKVSLWTTFAGRYVCSLQRAQNTTEFPAWDKTTRRRRVVCWLDDMKQANKSRSQSPLTEKIGAFLNVCLIAKPHCPTLQESGFHSEVKSIELLCLWFAKDSSCGMSI